MAKREIRVSDNPINGIINVVGEPDGGKTWFAFSNGAEPERTAFFDDDVKGKQIVKQVQQSGRKFAVYHNLMLEGKGMREIEFHNYCMGCLEEVFAKSQDGLIDTFIWDTYTRFENTFYPVVASNPQKYRQFYSTMGAIKGAEQWNASFDLESATLAVIAESIPLTILTSHLKKDAAKKDIAESKKPLIQKTIMRVWLRHSGMSPAPTGLVLKRLSKVDFSNGGMKPINVTHRKVYPFTWENLLYYWENPVGDTPPGPDETPNEFELSILDGILTKDQRDALRLAVLEAEKEAKQEAQVMSDMRRLTRAESAFIPDDPFALISRAMDDYGIEMDKLVEVLGLHDSDELMEIENVEEAWSSVKEYAISKTSKTSKANGTKAKAKTSKVKRR